MVSTNYKSIRSPIKWAGGKSRLRNVIVALIPQDHTCYVEPFGGAGWVLFAKPPSPVEVYNDIHSDLVNFFRVIKEKPKEFIESFRWTLVSREIFTELARKDPSTLTDVERAHRFFYLIMAAWGGESKEEYLRFQISIKDGGHGNRLIGALKTLEERVWPVYNRLRTVIIENLDWREILVKYDSEKTVFYLDPPYPGNGVNYHHNMRSWEEHLELLDALKSLRGKWILSSYKRYKEEISKIIPNARVKEVSVYSGMKSAKSASRTRNEEILVFNFDEPPESLELNQIHSKHRKTRTMTESTLLPLEYPISAEV